MHQRLQARGALVGEQVGMVRPGLPEHRHYARQRGLGASAHVQRLTRQPDRLDPDHRSSSRSHSAQSDAADVGQLTVTCRSPRRTSMRTSLPDGLACGALASVGSGIVKATNRCGPGLTATVPLAVTVSMAAVSSHCLTPRPRRHCLTKFAFRPNDKATAAVDAPGSLQAAKTSRFNCGLCRRRGRLR